MRVVKVLGQCLLQLVVIANGVHSSPLPVTCQAGTYVTGAAASVTCDFNINISAAQRDVSITRYPSATDTGTAVLLCKWLTEKEKLDCTAYEGFKFDSITMNLVKVTIPAVSSNFTGFYKCFFVPHDNTEAGLCQLTLEQSGSVESEKAVDGIQTTPPPNEGNTLSTTLIAAICVIGVVTIVCVMLGIFWKCFKKHKTRLKEEVPLLDLKRKQIPEHLEGLELPKKNLEASLKKSRKPSDLMAILERETKQGLDNITKSEEDNTTPSVGDDITQSDADLQMYRLYCPLMDQTGNAELLVVDVGSTHLKISFVILREQVIITSQSDMMKTASGIQMFAFIAESIKTFVCAHKLTEKSPLHAAIIFPFPCHQTSLNKAKLAKCTREFCWADIVNKDIQELLQKALQNRQTPFKVELVAIVNDAVSTLVSVAHNAPECKIGLTVGTGFNACFVEQWSRVGTSSTEETQPEGMVYNTELGALGDNGCLTEFRTDFDSCIDDFSSKPGSQIFEKMVSWTYIGDIVRLTLKSLNKEGLLLPDEDELGCKLFQQGSITSDHVAIIASDTTSDEENDTERDTESDTESHYQKTRDILTELEVTKHTYEELKTIRYVCGLVCERATYLTSAALATLINRLDQPGVMIVVDGELNKNLPRFGELLYSITNTLVKPELKDKFLLVSSNGRRNFGAALIAKAAMRHAQAAASSHSSQEKTHF